MTADELFTEIRERFSELLASRGLMNEPVEITCRSLSVEEAIGNTARRDFPIITGKDVMIQAEYHGGKGQAFTDAPSLFSGTLADVLAMDIVHDAHARSLFIASVNAVMDSLGLCVGTVHCRTEGPELCAKDMRTFLERSYPYVESITLVGYQPALLEMLANNRYKVRVLDLNPANIGQLRYGVIVEDGESAMQSAIDSADLILCTGSTLCNGTIVNYLLPEKEVLFFGITIAGCAELFGWKRVCFAEQYA